MRRVLAVLERSGPVLLLVAIFCAVVLPVLLAGDEVRPGDSLTGVVAGARDEAYFHLSTVIKITFELPTPELDELYTATTPGYHYLVALFAEWVSYDLDAMQAFAALFSLALVLVLYRLLSRFVDRWLAFALTLPLLLSHYVVQSAAWLNTDNAALLFVVLVLGVALEPPERPAAFARGGAFLLMGLWVRQLTLWSAAPFVLSAALAGRFRSLRPVAMAGVALVPALVSLAILAIVWGGLTPPLFRSQAGVNPAAIPFTLALVGFFGWFFVACVSRREDVLGGRAPLYAAAAGAVAAILPATTETAELQRRTGGGAWKVVDAAPAIADRSLVILVAAAAGAVVLVALWRTAARAGKAEPALVVLASVASLAIAQSATSPSYQRYFEPVLLVLLALLAALAAPALGRTLRAMAVLVAIQLVGVVSVVYAGAF